MTTSKTIELNAIISECQEMQSQLISVKAKLDGAIALGIDVESTDYIVVTSMINQCDALINQCDALINQASALLGNEGVDQYIGMACRTEFYVKRGGKYWHYYARIEQPWQIESEPFDNTVIPSKAHFHLWVIASLK